ncbi:MAG: hypothetical protein P1T08_08295 [Acidimicrobiia bacterium]|nr:hypothetical protein [Acidimicrobiia bacterium]
MIETKKAFYAAVGAPLVGLKRTGDALKDLSDKLTERFGDVSEKLTDDARKEFDLWADEGEKLIGKISEQKVVEDLSARVDLDEIQERVGKLRDQLEDILTSWRESFSPGETIEKPVIEVEKKPAAKTAAARKPAAKTAPARKPAAKKAPATKPAAKKPAAAAKKPTVKATAAKKPVAKKPAAKATAAK